MDPNGIPCEVAVGDVVATDSFAVTTAPFKAIAGGDQVQLAPLGRPAQLSKTTPLKPLEGVIVTVYGADCPALIVSNAGEAVSVKSEKKTDSVTLAVCAVVVPLTVTLSGGVGPVADAFIPLIVMVLLSPTVIVGGSKEHVAPDVHDNVMLSANELGPEALTVKVVVFVPICTTLDRLLAEREKTAAPVPVREALWLPVPALS